MIGGSMSFEYDQELDCSGLLVPMTTLKTKKAFRDT